MPQATDQKLINVYQKLADLTGPVCGSTCTRFPLKGKYHCCHNEYCEFTQKYAKEEWGIELEPTGNPDLLFMGDHGCVVAPHLRPLCTAHVCDISDLGFMRNDPKFTSPYFRLRNRINVLEYEKKHGKLSTKAKQAKRKRK